MRCVLDSNVAVKWLLQEDQSDTARLSVRSSPAICIQVNISSGRSRRKRPPTVTNMRFTRTERLANQVVNRRTL